MTRKKIRVIEVFFLDWIRLPTFGFTLGHHLVAPLGLWLVMPPPPQKSVLFSPILVSRFASYLKNSDVYQTGVVVGGVETGHVDSVTLLKPRVEHRTVRAFGEPFSDRAVAPVHGHDGGQLDKCRAQAGHGRLPVA